MFTQIKQKGFVRLFTEMAYESRKGEHCPIQQETQWLKHRLAWTGKGQGRPEKGVYSGNILKSASNREMVKRNWLKMKKLSSALYMLHLGEKSTIQVVISTKG